VSPRESGTTVEARHYGGAASKARATRNTTMNKEQVEGATQKGVGAVKEAAGKAVGNTKLQAEGMADKAVGAAKQAAGDVKSAVHKATK
jgi:uncharacterized protein YjbJ (UPF0337 family)